MIKRIRFAQRGRVLSFPPADAPPGVRPIRVAVCTTLPGLTDDPKHDGLGIEWFTDIGHLRRLEAWLGDVRSREGIVVAEEAVLRGAEWLERRWRVGGEKLKHMAIAVRADGLTRAEFSQRWRAHGGTAGNTVIPDDARGRAYVQNHPLPDGEWTYDAVNEVYLDDMASLRTRIDWFRENLSGSDDLVGRSWFLAVREQVV